MHHLTLNVLLYILHLHGLENLALHKPTWEQYPWPDKNRDFGSEHAVDGMYTDRGTGGQCTISDEGKYTATWRVDLGGVVSIRYIDIYYRTDNENFSQYLDRMAGFFVYVSNTTSKDDGYLCFHDESTNRNMLSLDQHINCTLLGRYVIYYNERSQDGVYPSFYSEYAYNGLCEVEVYGCNGTFGEDCINLCPTNCKDGKCDTFTGHCISCAPGYKNHRCDKVEATSTQPCSCTEGYNILIVVVSLLIVVAGSMINFVIWKRNATKLSRMSRENMPQPTNKTEDKNHQYSELEEVDKPKTYEEIQRYSN